MWKQSRIFGEMRVSKNATTEDENTSLLTLPNSELLYPQVLAIIIQYQNSLEKLHKNIVGMT